MTEFNEGDKVRMIGDPEFIGTVVKVSKCDDQNAGVACDQPMVTFTGPEGNEHSTHADDLEPADD